MEINWEKVILPSMGLYYAGRCPEGVVEIAPWTTAQEELVVRYGASDPDGLMNMLCKDNIKLSNGMEYKELLVTDRFFLLIQLRILSLVPYYTVSAACLDCEKLYTYQVDLSKDINVLVGVEDEAPEPIPVFLPKCKKTVGLKFLRVSDEMSRIKYSKNCLTKKNDKGDPGYRFNLAAGILEIEGKEASWEDKMELVKSMVSLDSVVMRNKLDEYATGYDLTHTSECSHCGYENEGELPLGRTFFNAANADIERALRMDIETGSGSELPSQTM